MLLATSTAVGTRGRGRLRVPARAPARGRPRPGARGRRRGRGRLTECDGRADATHARLPARGGGGAMHARGSCATGVGRWRVHGGADRDVEQRAQRDEGGCPRACLRRSPCRRRLKQRWKRSRRTARPAPALWTGPARKLTTSVFSPQSCSATGQLCNGLPHCGGSRSRVILRGTGTSRG